MAECRCLGGASRSASRIASITGIRGPSFGFSGGFVRVYPGGNENRHIFRTVSRFSGFTFFGGVPLSVLYDNTKIAVAKICGDGKRDRTRGTRKAAPCASALTMAPPTLGARPWGGAAACPKPSQEM